MNKLNLAAAYAFAVILLFSACSSSVSTGPNADGKDQNSANNEGSNGDPDLDFSELENTLPLVKCNSVGPVPGGLNPILFVTQVPTPSDFGNIASTFGNHRPTPKFSPRGGDLMIRYADGSIRNLTQEAGYGDPDGPQTANSIAVRDPSVHWCGKKALFSMVIGAPTSQALHNGKWQIYEVSGLESGSPVSITKVPNQPSNYNNVYPIYDSYGRIIFASDMPHKGKGYGHLYPVKDEYEMIPTNTGLWNLDPVSGKLFVMDHSPSGNFNPSIDSYGRVIFTRWDHAIRDDLALNDLIDMYNNGDPFGSNPYNTFNFEGEEANDGPIFPLTREEFFPEGAKGLIGFINNNGGANFPLSKSGWAPNLTGNDINFFNPWMMLQDGREVETLNHIGRHELKRGTIKAVFNDDGALEFQDFIPPYIANNYSVEAIHQMKEDLNDPGVYFATNAVEFNTHAAGQIVTISGSPGVNGDQMVVTPITHPATVDPCSGTCTNHIGFSRDPLMTSAGILLASHTSFTDEDFNSGSGSNPISQYNFRLKAYNKPGNYYQPNFNLTPGFTKSVSYWHENGQTSYTNVQLWELNAVEVVSRPVPAQPTHAIANPEIQAFQQSNISTSNFITWLKDNKLAMIIMRNVTKRDRNDKQQPFNLKVANSTEQTLSSNYSNGDKVYTIAGLQLVENKLIRGTGVNASGTLWAPGRRGIGQPMDTAKEFNIMDLGLESTVKVDDDGSVAAIVPAGTAMSWQLVDEGGTPVVRERIWVTFQPGEIRTCAGCHGVNEEDQAGTNGPPTNMPKAAVELLNYINSTQNLTN